MAGTAADAIVGLVEQRLDLRAEFAVEQVGGLGDDHGGGDQRLCFGGEQLGSRVVVGTVRSAAATSTPVSTISNG